MSAKTIHALNSGSVAAADEVPFWDVSSNRTQKTTIQSLLSVLIGDSSIFGIQYADRNENVTDHGDITQVGSIAQICQLFDGAPVCIVCAEYRAFPFLTSFTIPSNATIVMLSGAQITSAVALTFNGAVRILDGGNSAFNSTSTLTFNNSFSAGMFTVFEGGGTVVFSPHAVMEVLPQWWGAVADGSTDDTAAVAAAYAACPTYGAKLKFSAAYWKFNLTVNKPIEIEGSLSAIGDVTSAYAWLSADADQPVITVCNDTAYVNGIRISNFALAGDGTARFGLHVRPGTMDCVIENFSIHGFIEYNLCIGDDETPDLIYNNLVLDKFVINNIVTTADCVWAYSGGGARLSNFYIRNAVAGKKTLYLDGSTLYLSNGYMTCPSLGGIVMDNICANFCSNVFLGVTDVTPITINYTGSNATATMQITDTDADGGADKLITTTTGTPGDQLDITLSSCPTLADLKRAVEAGGKYTATIVAGHETDVSTDLALTASTINVKGVEGPLTTCVAIHNNYSGYHLYNLFRGGFYTNGYFKNQDGISRRTAGSDLATINPIVCMPRIIDGIFFGEEDGDPLNTDVKITRDATSNMVLSTVDTKRVGHEYKIKIQPMEGDGGEIDLDGNVYVNDVPLCPIGLYANGTVDPTIPADTGGVYHNTSDGKWYLLITKDGTTKKVELT